MTDHALRSPPSSIGTSACSLKTLVLLSAGLLVAAGAAWYGDQWWTAGRFIESTDDAYVGGEITVIAPKVAGFIANVAVTDNQSVHAGDLLVKLDDRDYRAALAKAAAAVAGQQATLANLDATRRLQQSLITQARADIGSTDAETVRARDDRARYQELSITSAGTMQHFEKADADFKKAIAAARRSNAAVEAAEHQLEVIDTEKQQAQAALAGAIADREMAQLNLSYTELRAPIDGTVGNRSARTGAYASTGVQLLSIVPATGLWVDANFKESQLATMRAGWPAELRADVLPGIKLYGHIVSLAPATGAEFSVLPPENATGNFTKIVQRVPVRILLDGDAAMLSHLRPGLSGDGGGERAVYAMTLVDLTPRQKVVAFATMCVGLFIALLDIQIVSASLSDIGGGLSAGSDETAWVQTSYLIAEIIVIPLSGWLSRVFSTRWLFAASAIGFTAASLMCGWAWDIHSMIVFRALQGFLGGSMIPLVFTSAFVFFKGQKVIVAAATIGALSSLAPTLGPTVGGWITDHYSWHWLFFINLVPGIFVAIVVPMLVKIDKPNLSLLRGADYLGMALMALFLGAVVYTLEEGPRWDWFGDETIRATAWVAGLSGLAFIWRSLTFENPVVDLTALKSRNFALGCFFSFVTGIGIFATIYLTPLFLGRVRGFSAWQIGLAVFSTGIFQVCAIPIYAVLAKRIDLRWLMMFGLSCFALSMWNFTPITHDWGWRELLLPQALRGFAQQFAVAPTVTLTLGALAPERLKLASGLFNLMRNLGGAIGIAGCATILNDRTNLHFLRLSEHLNTSNPAMMEMLRQMTATSIAKTGGDPQLGHQEALRRLWSLTYREAQTLTFADIFWVIMACFVIVTTMVPLMRKVTAVKGPSANAH